MAREVENYSHAHPRCAALAGEARRWLFGGVHGFAGEVARRIEIELEHCDVW